ncbi:endo-1,4-beta-xylanase [Thermocoleostomius sinensis]|uniref:Beta-xylanase n=1 Tax=Thermocoleostomius sinensis A174 TaxID=2016057 RepID=A0A9E9C8K4_9CYAN|nr:endo-1,4-beta-xylanase [Thermocoleostomius sinensis]WAL58532.1 endo-1,4-beta-xylanase [Thermocoleostomius sinensis A174]
MTRRQTLGLGIASLLSTFAGYSGTENSSAKNFTELSEYEQSSSELTDLCSISEPTCSLGSYAKEQGILYGAAAKHNTLSSDSEFATIFSQECRVLVPENDLKWEVVRREPGQFNFSKADWMAEFAQSNNLQLRGHTLLWHHYFPQWVEQTLGADNAEDMLIEHVQTVVKRYAGRMHSWDVVNEAVDHESSRQDRLRTSPWLSFIGPEYIDLAFWTAHEADPEAILVYNDNGLWWDAPEGEAKKAAVLQLLETLRSQGTPVHALGIQGHLLGHEMHQMNPEKLRKFLSDVSSLGLEIMITELDVNDHNLPDDVGLRDRLVAEAYYNFLSVVLDEPAVTTVVTWGLSDRDTWYSGWGRKENARPLPLDRDLNRKLAWRAIVESFISTSHQGDNIYS